VTAIRNKRITIWSYQPDCCSRHNPCVQSIDSFVTKHSVLSFSACTVTSPLSFREDNLFYPASVIVTKIYRTWQQMQTADPDHFQDNHQFLTNLNKVCTFQTLWKLFQPTLLTSYHGKNTGGQDADVLYIFNEQQPKMTQNVFQFVGFLITGKSYGVYYLAVKSYFIYYHH